MFHVEADVAVTQVCLVFMALVSWNGAGERVGRGILYGRVGGSGGGDSG